MDFFLHRACAAQSEFRPSWALMASVGLFFLGACSSSKSQLLEDMPSADSVAAAASQLQADAEWPDAASTPEAQADTTLATSPVLATSGPVGPASFPTVRERPFQRGGYWMNAYYFVRAEKNYAQLSQFLYGRQDRASLLAQWNQSRALKPGTLVYYNSTFRADDAQQMKIVADDFSLGLQSYTVRPGDTLSTIAQSQLGSWELWRELASLNRGLLASPDLIQVGQVLAVQPSVLDTGSVIAAFRANHQSQEGPPPAPEASPPAPELTPPAHEAVDEDLLALQNTEPPATGDPLADLDTDLGADLDVEADAAPAGSNLMSRLSSPGLATQVAFGVALLAVLGAGFYLIRRRRALKIERAISSEEVVDLEESRRSGTHS